MMAERTTERRLFLKGLNISRKVDNSMRRKEGFTLIELLVVIAKIALMLAILMPALQKIKKQARRVICGTSMHD